jgi:hypothetical protein
MDKTLEQQLEQAQTDLSVAQRSLEVIQGANAKLREDLAECQKENERHRSMGFD